MQEKTDSDLDKLHKKLKPLVNEVTQSLTNSELQSLLIEIQSERSKNISPRDLVHAWENDRFVQLAKVSVKKLLEFELLALEVASSFEPIELSPLTPLGTCSCLGPVSAKKALGTVRNTEVVSDSTNVMALESARLRRGMLSANNKDQQVVRLSTNHRLIRAQKFSGSAMMAHFKIFALTSAGKDTGNFNFEISSLIEHFNVILRLFERLKLQGYQIINERIVLYGSDRESITLMSIKLRESFPHLRIDHLGDRDNQYYSPISYGMYATNKHGKEFFMVDGGFTNWTQILLSNKKERFLISGLGSERTILEFS